MTPEKRRTSARFMSHVSKSDDPNGCWEWTGAVSNKGYGRFNFRGVNTQAHRVSFILAVVDIPEGEQVCHKCDNPKCVRPSHLFLGTNSDNQQDSVSKGRHWQIKKQFCRNGHPFTPGNTYLRKSYKNGRICKICANAQSKATYKRSKI